MTADEAIEECERWFRYIEYQKEKSIEIQKLAKLAREGGLEGQRLAKKKLAQIDRTPTVFSGERLEEAVRKLIAEIDRLDDIILSANKARVRDV